MSSIHQVELAEQKTRDRLARLEAELPALRRELGRVLADLELGRYPGLDALGVAREKIARAEHSLADGALLLEGLADAKRAIEAEQRDRQSRAELGEGVGRVQYTSIAG